MKLRMAVAMLISRFDMEFEPGYDPLKWYDGVCDYFNTGKAVLHARLSIRKA